MPPGCRACSIALHAERLDLAMDVLTRHPCVDPASVRWDGARLHYVIDLARVPDGDGPAVELVIAREVERC
jgi:hypothetical protein